MEKSELPEINVGVVGHIDHGKTTLLSRLTGKFTDTHSEELKRGITIKLGYADAVIYEENGKYNAKKGKPVRYVSFIDNPGHEMLMATMLSGAAIIDAAILVIAANEGIKPQTREHLLALEAKKIKNIIIVQNKIDLVSKEKALENYKEIKQFTKGTIAENAVIIPISAQQGINIDKIFEELCKIKLPERNEKAEPIFLVARSFDINRPGTEIKNLHGGVIGGILKQGTLKIGDEIEIKPGKIVKEANQYHYKTLKGKVIKLFKGSNSLSELTPGGSMSIETSLDPAVAKSDALSGNLASYPKTLPEASSTLKIKYSLFPEMYGSAGNQKVDAIKASEQLMLSINTSMALGIVKHIKPGTLELNLKIPVICFKGDNLGIARNINNHWRLIGYGEII